MKNFFKKLALVLALALVVTSVVPTAATTASAAAKITMRNGSKTSTVYVGKAYKLKLGAATKLKWTTSNKKVAIVGKTVGVMKPKAPGKVTISAKNLKTGNTVKKTFTVKLRATSIEAGEDATVSVGGTTELKAVVIPAKSTDAVRYYSKDKTIATVNAVTGVVTGVKAGSVEIVVYAKAAKTNRNTNKANKKDTLTVKVGSFIESAVQQSTTKLDVTFSADMKDAKTADFTITKDDTKANITVKGIAVDGKKVTVETFVKMNDAKTYTIAYKGTESTYKFTATDNKVISLAVTPITVPNDTATKISIQTKDTNGVILDEYAYGKTSADSKLNFTISTSAGYLTGEKLVLFKVGDTAKATATYHTYEYKDGKEVGAITTEVTITATDKSAITVAESKFTVAKNKPSNWSTATMNDKLALKDSDRNIYLYMKNSTGNEVTTGYTLESSNKDVLLVYDKGNLSAGVIAVTQGTGYVLVKDKNKNVVLSLPINVVAERKASALTLGASSLTLSKIATVADTKDVSVEVKDQYGDKMDSAVTMDKITVKCVGAPTDATKNTSPLTVTKGSIKFEGKEYTEKGDYQYTVTVGDFTQSISVSVKDVTSTGTVSVRYELVLNSSDLDIKFADENTTSKNVNFKVAALVDDAIVGYIPVYQATAGTQDIAGSNDGIVIKKGSDVVTGAAISGSAVTLDALNVNSSTKTVTKAAGVGSYSFDVTILEQKYNADTKTLIAQDGVNAGTTKTPITLTGGFAIKDTQDVLTFTLEKDTVDASSVEEGIAKAFKFTFGGTELKTLKGSDITASDIVAVDETKVTTTSKDHFIKSVTVKVPVDGFSVLIKIDVQRTFTMK